MVSHCEQEASNKFGYDSFNQSERKLLKIIYSNFSEEMSLGNLQLQIEKSYDVEQNENYKEIDYFEFDYLVHYVKNHFEPSLTAPGRLAAQDLFEAFFPDYASNICDKLKIPIFKLNFDRPSFLRINKVPNVYKPKSKNKKIHEKIVDKEVPKEKVDERTETRYMMGDGRWVTHYVKNGQVVETIYDKDKNAIKIDQEDLDFLQNEESTCKEAETQHLMSSIDNFFN